MTPEVHQQVVLHAGDQQHLVGRVSDVSGEALCLYVRDDRGLPPIGAEVELTWSSWRGLHRSTARRVEDSGVDLRLVLTEPVSSIQRRRYARVGAAVPVRLHLETGRSVDAITLDLSEGGLRVVLPRRAEVPDSLAVELPTLPTPAPQAAYVVRRAGDDDALTLALAFIPPIPAARALRSDVLARQARARHLEV